MAIGRLRGVLNLDRPHPLVFLFRCNSIYTGLETHASIFVDPNPTLPVLLGQIQQGSAAQQLVSTGVKGASVARDTAFDVIVTSMECELAMVQSLCDASPAQAASILAAASMNARTVATHFKPLLGLKNALPSGTVLLDANASLLDSTSRARTYNWGYTLDGRTFLSMPPTPTGKTSIANLTPLTTVGFRVSITLNRKPQGPWSETAYILVL